jgi:hypothetical protein
VEGVATALEVVLGRTEVASVVVEARIDDEISLEIEDELAGTDVVLTPPLGVAPHTN